MTETTIRQAALDALEATGQFDEVWPAGGYASSQGRPASDLKAVGVEPASTSSTQLGDDRAGVLTYVARTSLRIVVRGSDPVQRDLDADALLQVVKSTLNGSSLGGRCWPDFSRVVSWTWIDPKDDVERQVLAVFECRYLEAWN